MSLFRNLLVNNTSPKALYIEYSTTNLTDQRIDFASTAEMVAFTSYNTNLVTAKLVRKNTSETNVTLQDAFRGCANLTSIDFSEFDTDDITNMTYMLRSCSSLTSIDLSNFRTPNVVSFYGMFQGCDSLVSINFANIDTSSSTTDRYMFRYCEALQEIYWATNKDTFQKIERSSDLGSNGNTIYVPDSLVDTYKTASYFSTWAEQIVGIEPEPIPTLYIEYSTSTLNNQRVDFDTTADMKDWLSNNMFGLISLKAVRKAIDDGFADYSNFFEGFLWSKTNTLKSIDVSDFDIAGATNMTEMFAWQFELETIIGLSNLDTSLVASMNYTFGECYKLSGELDLSNWDTSNVTDMGAMTGWCPELTSIKLPNITTSNVTNMEYMFDMLNMSSEYEYKLESLYWATNKSTLQPLRSDSKLDETRCTIYVPYTLLSSYKTADNFSDCADRIVGV